ncbi:hypothetical protein OS176_01920 [Xanthomonadaceae bacterium XH05]|nr:hypothetical protein [Xanthomonadaceae bacterium XH05]
MRGILSSFLLLMSVSATAGIATIGPSADCNYVATGANNAIAQALADGRRDLRIVADTRNAGSAGTILSTASPSLSIRGGYSDCAAAAAGVDPAPAARSRWQASEAQTLMAVLHFSAERVTFRLSGFTLEPAPDASTFAANGGALVIGGPVDATLENVEMAGFRAVDRGGALMISSQADVRLLNTQIEQSRAARGGGIACENAFLWMDADSRLFWNYAAMDGIPGQEEKGVGGGAFLEGCVMFSESRVDETGSPLSGGVSYNQAVRSGGGMALKDSGVVMLGGMNCYVTPAARCRSTLATMIGNTAGGYGGAVHADNSVMHFAFANVSANTATHHGGGFAGTNNSRLMLDGTAEGGPRDFCLRNGACAKMNYNRAGSPPAYAGEGGAISLQASEADIFDAVLEDNVSDVGSSVALGSVSAMRIYQGALIQRNPTPVQPLRSMIFVGLNSSLSMHQSTAILDGATSPDTTGMVVLADGATFYPVSNVLFSRGAPLLQAQPLASIQSEWCNAVSDPLLMASLDAVHITGADFENALRPLRPATNGAMVDICESKLDLGYTDLEGMPRVVPVIPGRDDTPLDAGAYEVQNDIVFSDGFEATVE